MAEQPPHLRITLNDILSFPYRLCHPPPAVGKVRSWSVTPFVDVKLDDVLARKHIPPLGLKDFEEYLIFVEQAPENLYFILWLQDYTARHATWGQRAQVARPAGGNTLPPDSSLALFYARAKQTFFTPNAAFELDVPSDILAPFHAPSFRSNSPGNRVRSYSLQWQAQVVHPDPSIFNDLEAEVRLKLEQSLSEFIRAASTNVGSTRAACGITAGITFLLLAGLVPLVLETGNWTMGPHSRLMRLVSLPGIWLGLTILIASLHGVCIMIYVFGDIRQLRKFELERPPISRPIPVGPVTNPTLPKPAMTVAPAPCPPVVQPPSQNDSQGSRQIMPPSEPQTTHYFPSTASLSSAHSSSEDACDEISSIESFDISPAYFDPFPAPEGPATSAAFYRTTAMPVHSLPPQPSPPARVAVDPNACAFPAVTYIPPDVRARHPHLASYTHPLPRPQSTRANASVTPAVGARFIPPDDLEPASPCDTSATAIERCEDAADELERGYRKDRPCPEPAKPVFDFDLLPIPVKPMPAAVNKPLPSIPPRKSSTASEQHHQRTPESILGRIQYKCNTRAYHADTSAVSEKYTGSPGQPHSSPSRGSGGPGLLSSARALVLPRFTAHVPFLTPVTRVRSPVVVRAQWEVTVRSAALALVISAVLMGVVVGAVP
ncbi:hypothetical protein CONPUDRAFT_144195 [Coniophora puteana RWD-64-598 SS2]|uniref:RGS domain-containing protein n=1 Tax=Coniophora puteana (strain RWD-64-598) TaxID=741705 RepID=A0A5M3MQR8_CONPW|nr:uncharacterized protein CONPUDRAFT_144195 [Coniophora puteana RWD-64-598 SS2]EIW81406.1 hypothetical protein CONPUDRAFT_144195 [Coniophora puteana RWD-64-598 SS2]